MSWKEENTYYKEGVMYKKYVAQTKVVEAAAKVRTKEHHYTCSRLRGKMVNGKIKKADKCSCGLDEFDKAVAELEKG